MFDDGGIGYQLMMFVGALGLCFLAYLVVIGVVGMGMSATVKVMSSAGNEDEEIRASVMSLGRKGAEAWCLQKALAYDPELTQLELDTAYKNLKNMDLNELGDAIVEMDAL